MIQNTEEQVIASSGRTAQPADTAWIAVPKTAYRWVRRYPVLPVTIAIGLAVMALFAPWVAPNHPLESDLDKLAAPPVWLEGGTWDYVLGADKIGRDLLSRIIHGSRISLSVAFIVIICGSIIGSAVGIASGMAGGLWDEIAMRLVDLVYAIPFLLIALVAAVVFGASFRLVLILLTIFSWPIFARQTRGLTLQLKNMDYVASSRVAGASGIRIAFNHILPGVFNTIVVIATLQIGSLILTESVLSYLGVGIPAPQPAWGSMVADGREFITTAWWVPVMPGIAIFLTVFAFNFIGDWLRDYLDPRLRQIN